MDRRNAQSRGALSLLLLLALPGPTARADPGTLDALRGYAELVCGCDHPACVADLLATGRLSREIDPGAVPEPDRAAAEALVLRSRTCIHAVGGLYTISEVQRDRSAIAEQGLAWLPAPEAQKRAIEWLQGAPEPEWQIEALARILLAEPFYGGAVSLAVSDTTSVSADKLSVVLFRRLEPIWAGKMGCGAGVEQLASVPAERRVLHLLRTCPPSGPRLLAPEAVTGRMVPFVLLALAMDFDARARGLHDSPLHERALEVVLEAGRATPRPAREGAPAPGSPAPPGP